MINIILRIVWDIFAVLGIIETAILALFLVACIGAGMEEQDYFD